MDSYHRSFDLPVTILRPFNTFGPFQSARAIIPTILSQALAGDRYASARSTRGATSRSSPTPSRASSPRAVSDAAIGRTLQLGTGSDVSIGELVELIAKVVGRELAVEHDPARVRPPNSEVMRLISNPGLHCRS